jgi:Fis family transcriptional regulator, factor for inversion stimulation protein
VEKPLLEIVMRHADNNQSKAAQWLGLNRNTLRKKLLEHKLIT